MSDRGDGARPLLPLLSTHDLRVRRTAWRRRRTRRRVAGYALVMAVAAAGVFVVVSRGSWGRSDHRTRLASRTPLAGTHRAAREHDRHVSTGAVAVGPVERVLSYTSYVKLGTARKREFALTFDDGPGPYTPQILRVLERARPRRRSS